MDTLKSKGISLKAGLLGFVFVLAASCFLFGCAQEEPDAAKATNAEATPSSGSTVAPAVAQSSSANDAADGIFQLDVTSELESLKSAEEVKNYVDQLQKDTDDIASKYDSKNESSVTDANNFLDTLSNFNHYLPVLEENGAITTEDKSKYSAQVDQMILTIDKLVAA